MEPEPKPQTLVAPRGPFTPDPVTFHLTLDGLKADTEIVGLKHQSLMDSRPPG